MKKHLKISILAVIFTAIASVIFTSDTYAQSCECTRDQQRATCVDGGPEGPKCDFYTVSQTFNGTFAPGSTTTCEYTYTWQTCTDGGGSCSTSWNGTDSACTVSAPPPPPPPPPDPDPEPEPDPEPTLPPGWGGCGSCSTCPIGAPQQCVTHPDGSCLSDPTYCGSGPPPPPPDSDEPNCNGGIGGPTQIVVNEASLFSNNVSCNHKPSSIRWTILPGVNATYDSFFSNADGDRAGASYDQFGGNTKYIAGENAGEFDTVRLALNVSNAEGVSKSFIYFKSYSIAAPGAWWQVVSGGVTTGGSIVSSITDSCTEDEAAGGSCRDELMIENPDSLVPGTLVHANTPVNVGSGNISTTDQAAQANDYTVSQYSYEDFERMASGKNFNEITDGKGSGKINPGDFNTNRFDPKGTDEFAWIRSTGDLDIGTAGVGAGQLSVPNDKKAVVFVDGDLFINKEIILSKPESGFIMFIVSGDIYVDTSVGTDFDDDEAVLHGIYYTDGSFHTGTDSADDDDRLNIFGSVAAPKGSIELERQMGENNELYPAEQFVFNPDLIINYPITISNKNSFSREVAPR